MPGLGWLTETTTYRRLRDGTASRIVTTTLYVATMLLLIAGAFWIILHTVLVVANRHTFASILPEALGGIVLAIIVLELLETVYKQIGESGERLTFQLVMNFLIIGIVSAIRHILVIGAQLSLPGQSEQPVASNVYVSTRDVIAIRDGLLRELLTNVGFDPRPSVWDVCGAAARADVRCRHGRG